MTCVTISNIISVNKEESINQSGVYQSSSVAAASGICGENIEGISMASGGEQYHGGSGEIWRDNNENIKWRK